MTNASPTLSDEAQTALKESVSLPAPHAEIADAWKRAFDHWCQPLMEYFWPDLAEQVDWRQKTCPLSTELLSLTPDAAVGRRFTDKLYGFQLKSSKDQLLYVHIEMQTKKEIDCARRMYERSYRIHARYQQMPIPLMLLADTHTHWHPKPFQLELLGHQTMSHNALMVKLLKWQGQEAMLLESDNPAECLIALHLIAQRTPHSSTARFETRLNLHRALIKNNRWSKSDIINFWMVMASLMPLPKDLESSYTREVTHPAPQAYPIKNAERIGIKKGRAQEKRAIAKNLILQGIPSQTIAKVTRLTQDEIIDLYQSDYE